MADLRFYEGETQHFLRDPDERESRLIYRGALAEVEP